MSSMKCWDLEKQTALGLKALRELVPWKDGQALATVTRNEKQKSVVYWAVVLQSRVSLGGG